MPTWKKQLRMAIGNGITVASTSTQPKKWHGSNGFQWIRWGQSGRLRVVRTGPCSPILFVPKRFMLSGPTSSVDIGTRNTYVLPVKPLPASLRSKVYLGLEIYYRRPRATLSITGGLARRVAGLQTRHLRGQR